MKANLLLLWLLLAASLLPAQTPVWIFFADKAADAPLGIGSEAVESRLRQQIPLDAADLQVSAAYTQALREMGVQLRYPSRWLNAVSASISAEQLVQVRQLPFVKSVQPIARLELAQTTEITLDTATAMGNFWQLNMLGVDLLHELGYKGQGVKVAVFDNGFRKTNEIRGFTHVFQNNRVKYAYDFVDHDENVFEDCGTEGACKHGSWCWSLIAGYIPDSMSGSAPEADFMLFRTENDFSETRQEEDNWVRAAEVADSLGAQVFSTSLGYSRLDTLPYTPADMDGNTAIITRAADMAASRGIIVVNSAGNEGGGTNTWRIVIAPADGDSVIAVGGVNRFLDRASFSSQGNTADGRIKPDVMALGQGVTIIELGGDIQSYGSGTSFSCPIMAGMMACLRQARPNLPAWELRRLLLQSADRYANPDSLYGYGIPNATKILASTFPATANFEVFPNPVSGTTLNLYLNAPTSFKGSLQLFDSQGRKITEQTTFISDKAILRLDAGQTLSGLYFVRLINEETKKVEEVKKVWGL